MQEQIENELWKKEGRTYHTLQQIDVDKTFKIQEGLEIKDLPDPTLHKYISFIKSTLRITACALGLAGSLNLAFVGLILAEVVGVVEELV